MSSQVLLITGVTGFIGFKVLLYALEEGYFVRAAVRSSLQSASLLSHPKIQSLSPGARLSFVEVSDLARADAYDQAVEGVAYIIHLASPLPSPSLDPQCGIYEPTIAGVTNMLLSASRSSSLKKLVITASVFANMPFPPDPTQEITPESRQKTLEGPFDDMLLAYRAGKINAINTIDEFVTKHKPPFTVVNIFPGFVLGPDDKALCVKDITAGTNRVLLPIITGQTAQSPMPSGVAHVYDVAKIHILALTDGITGNLGVSKPHEFNDAWQVVQKHFPRAVEAGIFTQGDQPTVPVNWKATQTETYLALKFRSYDDIVVGIARQFLELSGLPIA